MKHFLREDQIKRKGALGRFLTFGGLAVLLGGFLFSLNRPEASYLVLFVALGGTLLSQVGIAMLNQWGRSPRVDETLSGALKGLDDRYSLFHYLPGVRHLITGPSGIFILLPSAETGRISHEDGRWWADGPRRGLLRRGGRREIGPLREMGAGQMDRLRKNFARAEILSDELTPQAVAVFLDPGANLDLRDMPPVAVHVKKLKSWLRRQEKRKSLTPEEVERLARSFGYS